MSNKMPRILELISIISGDSVRFRSGQEKLFPYFIELSELFLSITINERGYVIDNIDPNLGNKLIVLGSYAAERSLATRNSELIRLGIVSHLMENFSDYRNNVRNLALIKNAAEVLGVNFHEIVRSLLKFSTEHTKEMITNFCGRDDSMNDLRNFGIRLVMRNGMPVYISSKEKQGSV